MLDAHRRAISAGRLLSPDSVRARNCYALAFQVFAENGHAGLWSPFREAAIARLIEPLRAKYAADSPERNALDYIARGDVPGRLDKLSRFVRRNPEWLVAQIAAVEKAEARTPAGETGS